MKRKIFSIVAGILITSFGLSSTEGVTIKVVPKLGDTYRYRWEAKLDFGGAPLNMVGISTLKVVGVEPSGQYHVEENNSAVKVNGVESPPGSSHPPTTKTISASGELVKIDGEGVDQAVYRSARLDVLVIPDHQLKPLDTWTYDGKADKATGLVATLATYTFLGEERLNGIDCFKIKFLNREIAPETGSSEGTRWIRKADGLMLKLVSKWTNMQVGGNTTISGDLTQVLVPSS